MGTTVWRSGSESSGGGAGGTPGGDADVVGHIGPGGIDLTGRTGAARRPWPLITAGREVDTGDDDAYDALTDLFLGEVGMGLGLRTSGIGPETRPSTTTPLVLVESTRGDDDDRRAGSSESGVELLIMGHLPVLSTAWASQYARTVAEVEDTPVAFVQIRGGHATLEIVEPPEPGAPGEHAGEGTPNGRRMPIQQAVEAAADVTTRWVIRVDETDEPSLAKRNPVRWLTLLTSGDEAAVAGAYRAIKQLAPGQGEAGEAENDHGATPNGQTWGAWDGPAVRVALMGVADEAGDAAYAKIAAAARTYLGRPIRRAPGAAKIHAPRPSKGLFSGKIEGGAERIVGLIEEALRRGGTCPVSEPVATMPVETVDTPAAAAVPVDSAPVPTSEAAAVGSLARHLPGLRAVEIKCPYAEGVEFAVEPTGRLHVLGRRVVGGDPASMGVEPLMVASAWASSHASLIRQIVGAPQGSEAGGREVSPVSHVFVDEPKQVRRLLDTDLRVHLLAPVTVEGRVGWVCKELN